MGAYMALLCLTMAKRAIDTVTGDIGSPNLGFSIYDPTETRVYGFTRYQLQLLANSMWLVQSIGNVFNTMVMVSRLDIALLSVFASELAGAASIYYLLGKKKNFYPDFDTKDEYDEFMKSSVIIDMA